MAKVRVYRLLDKRWCVQYPRPGFSPEAYSLRVFPDLA